MPTAITPISPGPALPSSADPEATFDAAFEAFLSWQKTQLQPQANALAQATYGNTVEAVAAKDTATTKANQAIQSAADAAASEARLKSLDELWLGASSADPVAGRGGVPLVAGNAYVNTGTGLLRAYNGAAWVNGFNITAGVDSVNGAPGAVLLKTVGGVSLLGAGDIPVGNLRVSQHTASGTFTVPAGCTVIRPYALGSGAAGTTTNSGGGGGCAYGDIAVTPGASVTLSIAAGVAKVTYGGVDLLTANPASGTTGGTASKDASVTNGGAYSGGNGAANAGGASSGSPLGTGVNGTGAGGSGWGGAGGNGGGGGVGGPAVSRPNHFLSGPGLSLPSLDPLLQGLTGNSQLQGYGYGQSGEPGAGGGTGAGQATNQNGFGGDGGFGAGGGYGAGNGTAFGVGGNGGFGGGGGRGFNGSGTSHTGGAGGYGGGGGQGTNFGGAGGAAVIRIYY